MQYDPFQSPDDIQPSQVLALIKSYQFSEEIYHSDGYGHVQVQAAPQLNPYHISSLLDVIEQQQLWPSCIELLSGQQDAWLLNFSTEIQKSNNPSALNCLVQLTEFISDPSIRIAHLQYAAKWPWHVDFFDLLIKVKKHLIQIELALKNEDGLDAEIDFAMIQKIQETLEPMNTKLTQSSTR